MPLSEHEQRLLDQIERALYADDPKFADSVRTTDLARHYRRRVVRSIVLVLVGLAVMLAGIVEQRLYLFVGVAGFLIMVFGAWRGVLALRRLAGHGTPPPPTAPRPARRGRPRTAVRERFEQRWRRRTGDTDDS
jgi:hypothetical protein